MSIKMSLEIKSELISCLKKRFERG